ncbi:MAG: hypothetical protein KJO31_08230 [Gammaproteobacteria bacterium]|nr:hypothetical protein [Gammaproteobacteria bacterium]
MSRRHTTHQRIHRLLEIRNRYDSESSREKLDLLRLMHDIKARSSLELRLLHTALCFVRAFPDSRAHYREAQSLLDSFATRVCKLPASAREELWDTGIAGSPLHYRFSYEVALWLSRRAARTVALDWDDMDDSNRLDELLEHMLLPAEQEYFDSGYVRTRDWIEMVSKNAGDSEFHWLMGQLQRAEFVSIWSQLYNAADVALAWDLGDSDWSVSKNRLPVRRFVARAGGMRKPPKKPRQEITRPLDDVRLLSRRLGGRLIDTAMASLAVRHRETYHFNFANPAEVWVADVGQGVSVAVLGLKQEYRFPLECTMGYLVLANGVPVGYGGSSLLFRQVNTGLNIFPEYRGSEAAFLWLQVMRVYHHLSGCTRFIANPYQFGGDNTEALKSGAFWFYYRLGYRPVLPKIRKLASREFARMRDNRKYRCDLRTLTRLVCCDMHLVLPGARPGELFEERWIETSSMLATEAIGAVGGTTRIDAAGKVAESVAKDIGLRSMVGWSKEERSGFLRVAPLVAAARPASWSAAEKRAMRELVRAKGGPIEAQYARLLGQHQRFLRELRASCRRAEIH